jgi:hypothetical protein
LTDIPALAKFTGPWLRACEETGLSRGG